MRNLHQLWWILAMGALILVSGSCKSDDDSKDTVVDKPYTTIDSRVLGKWYGSTQDSNKAASETSLEVEFKADGTLTLKSGTTGTFTATNGTLTSRTGNNTKDQVLTYTINDTEKSIFFTNKDGPTVIKSGKFYKHLDERILGKWYTDAAKTNQMYEFKADGKFVIGDGATDFYAKYGAIFTAANSSLQMIAPGQTTEATSFTIENNTLTITEKADTGWTAGTYYKK